MIDAERASRSSPGTSARAASTSTCWPSRSRSSRCRTATSGCAATSTRASRTASPAATSPASTSSARCRTPRPATATPRPARASSTSPTASWCGCSSTTSRSTCATATLRSHERVLDLRAGTLERRLRVDLARRASAVRVRSHPAGVVRPTGRWPRSATRSRRWPTAPAADPAVRAGRQRDAAGRLRRPAGRRGAGHAAGGRRQDVERLRRGAPAPHPRLGLLLGAGMDHVFEAPGAATVEQDIRDPTGPARPFASTLQAGQALRVVKLLGVRLVLDPLRAGGARPGRRGAHRCPDLRVGGAGRQPARSPRRLLGRCRRRGGRRPGAAAGGAVRPVPGAAEQRAHRTARSRGQGDDRPGLRRPRLLGQRGLRAAGAVGHLAGRGSRRPALAPLHPGRRPGPRPHARARGSCLPVAHHRRRGVLRLLACGDGRLPRQRRHRLRGGEVRRRDRRRGLRRRPGHRTCWSRRRGCGSHSATTTGTGPGT